ncbi:MAG TPA: sulfotransferase [Acidimicrobiia bacterium]|nr:sulfotransferase [Acidimicrobiia bacterium]
MTAGPDLDAAQLLETASIRTGLSDFGPPTFREGLDRVVTGIREESRLNAAGEATAPEILVSYLVNRLHVVDWQRRYPEITEAPVVPPVVMIGMGRTGTTILHDLLGQDPGTRVPLTWEVEQPSPPPETATYETDPRIAEVQARIEAGDALHPEFKTMHPTGARLAQECIRFTGCEFASGIFLSQFSMPGYFDWLIHDADMAPTYGWHRRFLQLLQWRHPAGPGGAPRWVVKSGAHLWALPALVAEYPDALFIQTHRDPLRVIPSLSSLFATVHRLFSDEVTIPRTAAEWAGPIVEGLDRSVDARESGLIPPSRVVDVQFQEFVADPFGVIRAIYDHWGAELTADAEARMRAFLGDNARDKHGSHRYAWDDTGLDEGEWRERCARYTAHFDVPADPLARG